MIRIDWMTIRTFCVRPGLFNFQQTENHMAVAAARDSHFFFFSFFFLLVILLLQSAAWAKKPPQACVPPHDQYVFCNTHVDVTSRVADLMTRLTLQEKINQTSDGASAIGRLGIPQYE